MKSVSEILSENHCPIHSISPGHSVYQALEKMNSLSIGALMVLDEAGKILGIFSERDYTRKVELAGKDSKATTVKQVMVENLVCVRPEDTGQRCFELMYQNKIRHLPVVTQQGHLIGVLAILDVVHSMLTEQNLTIEHLEEQITQAWPF